MKGMKKLGIVLPSVLHIVVGSFDEDAKKFILKATREYLKHHPAPQHYDKEFFEKAIFWYVHTTGRYISPDLFSPTPWLDFSSDKDTLWLDEALRGEKYFTCITLSSLLAVLESIFGSDADLLSIPGFLGWTPHDQPPLELHILAEIGDSIAINPDDLSKIKVRDIKYYIEAEKEINQIE